MSAIITNTAIEAMGPDDRSERKALLSDEDIRLMTVDKSWPPPTQQYFGYLEGGKMIRDFYEAKITSGELMEVPARPLHGSYFRCLKCAYEVHAWPPILHFTEKHHRLNILTTMRYCPGCGVRA